MIEHSPITRTEERVTDKLISGLVYSPTTTVVDILRQSTVDRYNAKHDSTTIILGPHEQFKFSPYDISGYQLMLNGVAQTIERTVPNISGNLQVVNANEADFGRIIHFPRLQYQQYFEKGKEQIDLRLYPNVMLARLIAGYEKMLRAQEIPPIPDFTKMRTLIPQVDVELFTRLRFETENDVRLYLKWYAEKMTK